MLPLQLWVLQYVLIQFIYFKFLIIFSQANFKKTYAINTHILAFYFIFLISFSIAAIFVACLIVQLSICIFANI